MTEQASRITLETTADRAARATGILDSHTADEFGAWLDSFGTDSTLELDLSEVSFIDSSGLRALVTSHQSFEEAGGQLVLERVSDSVKRLFELTGLTDHLRFG